MQYGLREDDITPGSLFRIYQQEFFAQDFGKPPTRTAKDMTLLRRLIEEQGGRTALEYLVWALENFPRLKKQHGVSGYPTVGVLWGFRMTFLAVMNEPRANSIEYRTKSRPSHKEAWLSR